MNLISKTSKSGKKAHCPLWWLKLMEIYPQFRLGLFKNLYLKSKTFKSFIDSLPKKCPFERQYWIGDTLIMFIPPLCPFNPFFYQFMELKSNV